MLMPHVFFYFYWLQKYSLRLEQVWIFVTVFYRCKTGQKNYAKQDGETTSSLFCVWLQYEE